MTYEEQLNSINWRKKRSVILNRDSYKCKECSNDNLVHGQDVKYGRAMKQNQEPGLFLYRTVDMRFPDNKVHSITVLRRAYIPDEVKDRLPEYVNIYYYQNLESDGISYKNPVVLAVLNSAGDFLHVPGLHVHHTFYQMGKMAWEYPDEALKTLCWGCHERLHKTSKVPYLDELGRDIGELTHCFRCCGAGRFPEFRHVQGGICFRCSGAKYEEFITN